ncbi:hypothetical protein DFR59_102137 [Falsibacillus pallidus]|uniref:Uncharacterized protein n=1 Tax=Falsibacillus pallidus TaxID=493781 RepID=A0A370GQ43_9BACI|nr:hypothetical protein DFR59_102137 [Falsibacillus pallidus]
MTFLKNYVKRKKLFLGASFLKPQNPVDYDSPPNKHERNRDIEKYFRPSCLPLLNKRIDNLSFFDPYYDKKTSQITVPANLLHSPEETILNYFSILREAENLTSKKLGGCGTVGFAKIPFPLAYQFLTREYQKEMPYRSYLKSFEGIGHTNLLKLEKVPTLEGSRWFIEVETIEGTDKLSTNFAYYYGFVEVQQDKSLFKISRITLYPEDFLCAAYHGWDHDAEAVVDVKFGEWCGLIKKRMPTKKDGFVKTIEVIGKDGSDYKFIFFQLTNNTDVLISQYKRKPGGPWELSNLDPESCLNNKTRS